MQPWPFLILTYEEHRHNTFAHVCTVHHAKIFAGVGNKPDVGLRREGSLVLGLVLPGAGFFPSSPCRAQT